MSSTVPLMRSVQSMTVGKSNQSVLSLFHKDDTELVKMYGLPASVRLHANGSIERTWNVDSGQLHVTHGVDGKVADVKFFNNITADEMQTMMGQHQA